MLKYLILVLKNLLSTFRFKNRENEYHDLPHDVTHKRDIALVRPNNLLDGAIDTAKNGLKNQLNKRTEGLDDEWNVRDECVFMRELERGIERRCVCFSSCAFDVWLCVCVHEICAQLYICIQERV